jgi:ribonucleoside-diphosphate reductase alpha chain
MDSFATTVSVALQYGVPLRDLVNKFAHVRFEPSGFTGNQEIPIAKSIIDYIFRWLGSRFLEANDKAALGLIDRSAMVADYPAASPAAAAPLAFGKTADASVPNSLGGTADPTAGGSELTTDTAVDQPKASTAVEAPPKAEAINVTESVTTTDEAAGSADGARVNSSSSPAPSSELSVIAENGSGNGHAKNGAKTNGSTITLSLGTTNVAFKIQEDAPSCAECGSIMVRNGQPASSASTGAPMSGFSSVDRWAAGAVDVD